MNHFSSISHAALGVLIVSEQALTLSKGDAYNPVATAVDANEGAVSVARTQEVQVNESWNRGAVNSGKRGKYRDIFEASDTSGNVRRLVRTITVK